MSANKLSIKAVMEDTPDSTDETYEIPDEYKAGGKPGSETLQFLLQ